MSDTTKRNFLFASAGALAGVGLAACGGSRADAASNSAIAFVWCMVRGILLRHMKE